MDHRLVNDSSFSTANSSSYTLSEIWPFSVNDGVRSGQDFATRDESVEYSGSKYLSAAEESTVTEQTGVGRKRRGLSLTSEDESSKMKESSKKKMKNSGSEGENENGLRPEGETSSGGGSKATQVKNKPEPPKDYIHVRARRGQATDRHSLAERARRETISERMKVLQDLIRGCNKIIGKALVLDEIINYILSLQRQVEFLSMKLQVINSNVSTTGPKIGMFPSGDLITLPIEDQCPIFDQQEGDEA